MSEVTLFKNHHGNCNVALRSGEVVPFVQAQVGGGPGQFFTTKQNLIHELTAAAQEGEFGVFIDPNESSIDPEAATPMQQMEKRIRAEIMAELENKKVDAGTSTVSTGQTQAAISSTAGGVADGSALSTGQAASKELIQPEGSQSTELSILEKLKQGQGGQAKS